MRNKKKDKIIVGTEILLLCMMIGILRINAASSNPLSSEVDYNKNSQTNVQGSINDLYSKVAYGDAKASDILKGKKALVGGKEVIGTYTCPTLASQTPGDAIANNIDEGKVAWVNGNRIIGTRATLANKLELGDYVSYTPVRTSYIVQKDDRGVPREYEEQIIHPSKLKVWRVIRKNSDGTVDLVSNGFIDRYIMIGGKLGYKNYIETLNKIASAYETEGVTVGSRHMGYDKSRAEQYLVDDTEILDYGYRTDVELVKSAIGSILVEGKGDYFLASRTHNGASVSNESRKYEVGFVKASVTGSSSFLPMGDYDNVFTIGLGELGMNGLARPIVVLKSTLKITGGNGTVSSPYTLGV